MPYVAFLLRSPPYQKKYALNSKISSLIGVIE